MLNKKNFFFLFRALPSTKKKTSRSWIFFFSTGGPQSEQVSSINGIPEESLQFCMHGYTCIKIIFFKSGQIYMKDAERAESKEKLIFRFLFFELWSFMYSNFHFLFSKFRTFHKNMTISERGEGGLHILSWDRACGLIPDDLTGIGSYFSVCDCHSNYLRACMYSLE